MVFNYLENPICDHSINILCIQSIIETEKTKRVPCYIEADQILSAVIQGPVERSLTEKIVLDHQESVAFHFQVTKPETLTSCICCKQKILSL